MLREDDFPAQFPLKHMTKDAKFIVDTAFETGAVAPLAHLLLHLYRLGVSRIWATRISPPSPGCLGIWEREEGACLHHLLDFSTFGASLVSSAASKRGPGN
jgi:hypothetical protein